MYRKFIVYQSTVSIAASMIFPFYVLMLKNAGSSFSQFGWAYGLFALTAALSYPVIGRVADRTGDLTFMKVYSWGMAIMMLLFPLATEIWQVYVLQIGMGLLGAVQKNSEKNGSGADSGKRNRRVRDRQVPYMDICRSGSCRNHDRVFS